MATVALAFALAFALAVAGTRLVMILAWKVGAVDVPDGYRKLHKQATPRLGGIAVGIATCAPIAALLVFPQLSQVSRTLVGRHHQLLGLLIGGAMALAVGAVDDIFNLRARWKLLWQIVIATTAFAFGFAIKTITNPFGAAFDFSIISFPITIFWFVGCMNAVNLLDGLDGLAAGACLFVFMTLFLLSLQFNNVLGMLLMACVGGAVLGFLVFNFPPARIFLGDSGSLLLGFLVAALSLIGTSRKAETAVALFVPVVTLGVPILDTTLAIVRRWYKRLPISSPDRGHIHHVLVGMGYSQRKAVLMLYAICVLLAGAALLLMIRRNEIVILVLGCLIIVAFVFARIFSGVEVRDIMAKLSRDRMRNDTRARSQMIVERAMADMKTAQDMDRLWDICAASFKDIGHDYVRMEIVRKKAEGGLPELATGQVESWEREWTRESVVAADKWVSAGASSPSGFGFHHSSVSSDRWCVWLSLKKGDQDFGRLAVGRSSGPDTILPGTGEMMGRFRVELESAVARIVAEKK